MGKISKATLLFEVEVEANGMAKLRTKMVPTLPETAVAMTPAQLVAGYALKAAWDKADASLDRLVSTTATQ